jgi:hypothetical protein
MERLRHLIKEILSTPPKKDSCNCGCHSCDNVGNEGVVLNESLVKKDILSENLRYHVDKQLPLTENTFRYGSQSFLNLWAEARALYLREIIHVNDDDKEILEETDLGNYGMYEGKKVSLDLPMLEEEKYYSDERAPTEDEEIDGYIYQETGPPNNQNEKWTVYKNTKTGVRTSLHRTYREPERPTQYTSDESKPTEEERLNGYVYDETPDGESEKWAVYWNPDKNTFTKRHRVDQYLNETEKKKNPPLGKPKRGGSKKFYVYVKNPKTKKIKKVSFGDTSGLSAKINNPEARRAFAKRHDCANKKDKTKASYWSCRLPRYAKLLGLKSSFSGFW